MNQERLARLKSELAAIEKWDEMFHHTAAQDLSERVAHQARQLRRREIMREIQSLESHTDLAGAA